MIFLFPLTLSIAGTLLFLISDVSLPAKVLMASLTATSLLLQFVSPFDVHFLVPLALQIVVCIWVVIWWQLD